MADARPGERWYGPVRSDRHVPTETAVDGAEVTATIHDGASHAEKICLSAPYDPDRSRIKV